MLNLRLEPKPFLHHRDVLDLALVKVKVTARLSFVSRSLVSTSMSVSFGYATRSTSRAASAMVIWRFFVPVTVACLLKSILI